MLQSIRRFFAAILANRISLLDELKKSNEIAARNTMLLRAIHNSGKRHNQTAKSAEQYLATIAASVQAVRAMHAGQLSMTHPHLAQ